jgi:uncharacterized membrane protein YfcA
MYGTLLSPILIAIGFNPIAVVPAILISQAVGGVMGTIFHHKRKNADFRLNSKHFRIVLAVVLSGLLATAIGVYAASNIPSWLLKSYIGVLVIFMGVLCIFPLMYTFKWWKLYLIGFVSSFNKSFSGGGFGPITSAGKILAGVDAKVSVATTTYAEAPICMIGWILWYIAEGSTMVLWFPLVLIIGAAIGGAVGPYITSKINTKWLKIIVGVLAIISGLYICWQVVSGFNQTFSDMLLSFVSKNFWGWKFYATSWYDLFSQSLTKTIEDWLKSLMPWL